jgi:hypothetical protein
MPSSNKSSKVSTSAEKSESNPGDYISQIQRFELLDLYAQELDKLYPNIKVQVSDLEYRISSGEFDSLDLPSPDYLSSTSNTLTVLRYLYPKSIIGMGLGIDNCYDLSSWNLIDIYLTILSFILICDREPSESSPGIDIKVIPTISVSVKSIKTQNQIIKIFGLNSNKQMHFRHTACQTHLRCAGSGNASVSGGQASLLEFNSNRHTELISSSLIQTLEKIGELITVLNAPIGWSSSNVRKICNSWYLSRTDDKEKLFHTLEMMCGILNVRYIFSNNIFNPHK